MNEPHLRINTESLLSDYEFSYTIDSHGDADFTIKCHRNGIYTRLSEIKSYWDRRPHKPREFSMYNPDSTFTKEEGEVALEEASEFSVWMRYLVSDLYSIGSPIQDQVAECKLLQLVIANEVRNELINELPLRIPETVIGNRKKFFSSLLDNHSTIAIKPIASDGVSLADGLELPFLTQRINSDVIAELSDEAYAASPTLMQPYISKQYELRITMVGSQAFACKIESSKLPDDAGGIDWRAGYGIGIPQSTINIPSALQKFCHLYLKKLNLNFGCFDFIVDSENTYWFLECNPNGQWLWIEEDLNLPISKSIAKCLAAASSL